MARLLGLQDAPKEARLAFSYFRRGWTCKQIDEHFKWVPGSAHMLIRGIWEHDTAMSSAAKRKRSYRRFSDAEVRKIMSLYRAGASYYEIGITMGSSYAAVQLVVKREMKKGDTSASSQE